MSATLEPYVLDDMDEPWLLLHAWTLSVSFRGALIIDVKCLQALVASLLGLCGPTARRRYSHRCQTNSACASRLYAKSGLNRQVWWSYRGRICDRKSDKWAFGARIPGKLVPTRALLVLYLMTLPVPVSASMYSQNHGSYHTFNGRVGATSDPNYRIPQSPSLSPSSSPGRPDFGVPQTNNINTGIFNPAGQFASQTIRMSLHEIQKADVGRKCVNLSCLSISLMSRKVRTR